MVVMNKILLLRNYFRDLTVKKQFFLAGALSTGLLLCLCIYGIIQLDATNRQTSRLTNIDMPALQSTNKLYLEFLKLSDKNLDHNILTTNIDREFITLLNYDLTVIEFEKLQNLQQLWNKYKITSSPNPQFIASVEAAIIILQNTITEEARLRSIKVSELFSITRQRIFSLLIIGIILICFFYYQLSKRFLAPLNKGLGLVRAMQRGDLSTRININSNNEIGTLCQALNRTCVALAEKAYQEAIHNEKIYQANKLISLGTLVAGVAHEINNPNSNITFNTPLLNSLLSDFFISIETLDLPQNNFNLCTEEYFELKNNILGMIDTIEKSAYRIKAIVNGLRDYSIPVTEPHDFVRIEINELITTTFRLIGKQLEKSIYHIDLSLLPNKIFIMGNFIRLEQVLVNIINNAKEAMFDIDNSSLSIAVIDNNDMVTITIADNGIGIKDSILNQIMDPFFTTKRDINGTGLGLSVVAAILNEHNAEIVFDSSNNFGTKVSITFLKD